MKYKIKDTFLITHPILIVQGASIMDSLEYCKPIIAMRSLSVEVLFNKMNFQMQGISCDAKIYYMGEIVLGQIKYQ